MNNITFFEYIGSYFRCIKDNINSVLMYKRVFKNYFQVIYNLKRNNFPINCILKNGSMIQINKRYQCNNYVSATNFGLSYDLDSDYIYNFPESPMRLFVGEGCGETSALLENHYKNLSVKNKIVIDIGANIGDTAIFFILLGAKKVIGLEPFGKNYDAAKKNIEINNLSDKIEILHAACSDKTGFLTIKDDSKSNVRSTIVVEKNGLKVPTFDLTTLVNNYQIDSAVLKLDCEGCEYESILNCPPETLQKFSEIILEYHHGYQNIKEKLEKNGFKVNYTKPSYTLDKKNFIGILFATRS